MIFISGIHGVGKSYFAEKVKERCNIDAYTASALICDYKKCSFDSNKKVSNISDNQTVLLEAVKEKNELGKNFLLDGHFCLLDKDGKIERIEFNTYIDLAPKAILLLTEKADVIIKRRKSRDEIELDISITDSFQHEEERYALEVAEKLNVPVFICIGSKDIEKAIDFIIKNI